MNRLKVLTGARLCRFVPSGQRTHDSITHRGPLCTWGIGAAAAFSILAKYKYDHMLVGGIYEEVR
jgi:hypothetical protein